MQPCTLFSFEYGAPPAYCNADGPQVQIDTMAICLFDFENSSTHESETNKTNR